MFDIEKVKEGFEWLTCWYSIEIKTEEIDSYWEGKACIVTIKPIYHFKTEISMHVEFYEDSYQFEQSEDNWQRIDDEKEVWAYLYFESLNKIDKLTSSSDKRL